MTTASSLEQAFRLYWLAFAPPDLPEPISQYRFAPPRRWAFDFAWPDHKIAVEIEGGVWVNGRHNRASGYMADCEKYNAAALNGWRVLRYAGSMLDDMQMILNDVERLLTKISDAPNSHSTF